MGRMGRQCIQIFTFVRVQCGGPFGGSKTKNLNLFQARLKLKTVRLVIRLSGLLAAISVGAALSQAVETPLTDNRVYRNNCAKCHGKTAEGRLFGGPSLVSEKVRATPEDELMSIITNGKG